ncbi:GNAT family N-acetyltransferase [Bacillus sp. EB01]|uniref:GNAT family N-acetyltransferase n=1 Tax=Bacillus sp. EB01 TaxID=1347086 RepID=UPI000694028F|nr:GNAT family N-acetyltransferase [Bacillus sp. EB01]
MDRVVVTDDYRNWGRVEALYKAAFGSSAKPAWVIENMFKKQMCSLYILEEDREALAAGRLGENKLLLIDYLAVDPLSQGKGLGYKLTQFIMAEAKKDNELEGVVLEAAADDEGAISFWQKYSFTRTSYVHQYKWVPEPYIALVHKFKSGILSEVSPQFLFELISKFHANSFKRQKK